ncbi:MAG TPA: CHAD domain-containing protein [Phycisphaerales bacterium]|nr:CHAD domain-containing protein [Phycisphaerales bacterium]
MVQNTARAFEWKLSAETPLEDAVARVLKGRLKDVEKLVRKHRRTGKRPGAKFIHALRVSCRRAEAGLEMFEQWLPARRVKKLRKRLRDMRRSAGRVRICDVQSEMLRTDARRAGGDWSAAVEFAVAEWRRERSKAMNSAEKSLRRTKPAKLRKNRKQLFRNVTGDAVRLGDVVAARVPVLVDELLVSAADDLRHVRALHQCRLATKRLRYSVEAIAQALDGESAERWLGGLETLSGRLGAINDTHEILVELHCLVAAIQEYGNDGMKGGDRKSVAAGLEDLVEMYQLRLTAQCDEYRSWWQGFLAEDILGTLERTASRAGWREGHILKAFEARTHWIENGKARGKVNHADPHEQQLVEAGRGDEGS